MSTLSLSLAIGAYDRTRALHDGRIQADGLELVLLPLESAETFVRMVRYQEFDAAEMSLGAYSALLSQGDDRFVGIPFFPSRLFRHRDIFVSAASDVPDPAALRGKTIALRRYHMTAAIWQRGMLSDDYGVKPEDVDWVSAGISKTGRIPPRISLALPPGVHISRVHDRTIDDMLCSGEVDAGLLNLTPPSFRSGDPRIRRLFSDPRAVESEYWKRTGIFPIMHLVVVRRDRFANMPWIGQSIFKALARSQAVALEDNTHDVGTSPSMLPFFHLDAEGPMSASTMWPLGVSRNRETLDTLLRYCQEQGITERRLAVDDLFPEEVRELAGWEGVEATPMEPVGDRTWD